MKQTLAYLYKWTELSTSKWYIGVRFAKGCHPNDGYICSSRLVKPMITENSENWKREVLCIGLPDDMISLEEKYLSLLDAKNDPMSYNQHNGDGDFRFKGYGGNDSPLKGRVGNRKGKKNTPEHNAKNSAARKGKPAPNKGKPMSDAQREKLRIANTGVPKTKEANKKRSEALKGRTKTDEHKANVSAALTGKQRPKVVCRLSDRKEMCLAHFNRYVK
jgi:hypothetical protein